MANFLPWAERVADTKEDNTNVEKNPLIDGEAAPDASVGTRELDKAG